MKRFSSVALCVTLVLLAASACRSNKADAPESPTVQPSDPSAIGADGGEGGGASQPGDPGYVGTDGTRSGEQTTYSGLKYEVLRPGTGAKPSGYSKVRVHYHGTLPNGTVFDSSRQRGTPAEFRLDQVIAGWREGIPLMREGARYRFTVPPHLGYGARGMPPTIGPNQTLIFDVELLQVLH